MIKIRQRVSSSFLALLPLLCLGYFFAPVKVCAEKEPPLLVPRRSSEEPLRTKKPEITPELETDLQEEGPVELRPKTIRRKNKVSSENNEISDSHISYGAASPLESVSFSLMLATALISENFYEKRFQSFGDLFLFSIPLSRLDRNWFLHLETGPGFTFARLKLTAPNVSYNHLYLLLPAHLRLIYTVSKKFHVEALGGIMLRVIEYDSRDTTDGGTHTVKDGKFFAPDGALGLSYAFTPALKARISAGYLFFSGGLELTL